MNVCGVKYEHLWGRKNLKQSARSLRSLLAVSYQQSAIGNQEEMGSYKLLVKSRELEFLPMKSS